MLFSATSQRITLASESDLAGWRDAARGLLESDRRPEEILWQVDGGKGPELDFGFRPQPAATEERRPFHVPRAFLDLAAQAILHSDPERFALLYQLLFRLRSERGLMEIVVDPLVGRIAGMAKSVRRDIHKMHAFVRFRAIGTETGEQFIAWFEPDHHIVEAAAPFFQRRFAAMRWSILTPEEASIGMAKR